MSTRVLGLDSKSSLRTSIRFDLREFTLILSERERRLTEAYISQLEAWRQQC
jgi:hypothetical protein